MSGHNKWSKLKHTKGKTDAQRAKMFTKMGRELAVIARTSGSDPATNGRLRDAISKARKLNMSGELISRAINKSSAESANLEEIVYEGYALHGVAVIVECLTDNRNRTAGEVRCLFDKHGAGLGTSGSAIFMFEHVGQIFLSAKKEDEDDIMLAVIDAGAKDCEFNGEEFIITCEIDRISTLRTALEKFGETESEIVYAPVSTIPLAEEQANDVEKLCEFLEESDDVQNVYHNMSNI